jgi:hypothetical protein
MARSAAYNIEVASDNTTLKAKAKAGLQDYAAVLKELGQGRFDIGVDEFQAEILPKVDDTRNTIRAVSVSNPGKGFGWWDSSQGRAYWEANQKARKNHVKIERIFIPEENDQDAVYQLALEQSREGVEVYIVDPNAETKIPPNLQLDFAIFDRAYEWETRLNAAGQIDHFHCSTLDIDITHRLRNFDTIKKEYASEFEARLEPTPSPTEPSQTPPARANEGTPSPSLEKPRRGFWRQLFGRDKR